MEMGETTQRRKDKTCRRGEMQRRRCEMRRRAEMMRRVGAYHTKNKRNDEQEEGRQDQGEHGRSTTP